MKIQDMNKLYKCSKCDYNLSQKDLPAHLRIHFCENHTDAVNVKSLLWGLALLSFNIRGHTLLKEHINI